MRGPVIVLLFFLSPCFCQDPAPSWLSYAVSKTSGPIRSFNATIVVPQSPKRLGSYLALWIGIEPSPALNLIQPILAWGEQPSSTWEIFNEHFNWDGHRDRQGPHHVVKPGQTIQMSIVFHPSKSSYVETVTTSGYSHSMTVEVPQNQVFNQAFVVLEHQPRRCEEYPPSGVATFTNIQLDPPGSAWKAQQEAPACQSQAHVLNATAVSITWSTA